MRLVLQIGTSELPSFEFIMLKVFNNALKHYITSSLTNRVKVAVTLCENKYIFK
jgi:hypothetical protein